MMQCIAAMFRHRSASALRTFTRCPRVKAWCYAARAAQQRSCSTVVFLAPTEEHLQHFAALLAQQRNAGDCYCLYGSVGAGKSVFSRAYVRAAAEDPQLPVPSPTYLLQLMYTEQDGPPIHHFDLYRLDKQSDLSRLDLSQSFSQAVSLVEWADRLPEQLLPAARLEVHIEVLQGGSAAAAVEDRFAHQPQQQQQQQQQQQELLQALKSPWQHQQQCSAGEQVLFLPTPLLHSQGDGFSSGSSNCSTCGSSSSSSSYGETEPSPDNKGEPADDFDDAELEEDDPDPFTDQRWRRVLLRGVGDNWAMRLQQLAQQQQQQQQQPW